MKLLLGKPVAENILAHIKERCASFSRPPGLAAVLVGKNDASLLYVDLKKRTAKRCGIEFFDYLLPEVASEEEVLSVIRHLNNDMDIDGILIQLPLPKSFRTEVILETIHPDKDVDGLTSKNRHRILSGLSGFVCPFPRAITEIIVSSGELLERKQACVLANSQIFIDIATKSLEQIGLVVKGVVFQKDVSFHHDMQEADVIVTATGVPNLIHAKWVRDSAIVIDGGIDRSDGVVRGDVDMESFRDRDITISPVPGGVGPLTVACLLENVVEAVSRRKA